MTRVDARGTSLSGATGAAAEQYEHALAAASSWHAGASRLAQAAAMEAPRFVMAHLLQAHLLVGSRDPRRVRSARPILERALRLPATDAERAHMAVIAALLDDRYEVAKAQLGELLTRWPRDLPALLTAHALDYTTGDVERLAQRVEDVLPAWSRDMPGYHAVLAMHAFGLEETGQLDFAETRARAALELNPADARAHHVMAHVFEAGDRAGAGIAWMVQHAPAWEPNTTITTHGWWHVALFHLACAKPDQALAVYDSHVRSERSNDVSDLIDATSLLWRARLAGVDGGARWIELAGSWEAHMNDGYCSFTDLHAMLAFVGADDGARASRLGIALARASESRSTRYSETTRSLGLPAYRALMAYGRGDDALAITLLACLPSLAHRFGGSHAQRDVLHLTLLDAVGRMRRPARRAHASVG